MQPRLESRMKTDLSVLEEEFAVKLSVSSPQINWFEPDTRAFDDRITIR
jgi:hypothetical protein